MPSLLLVEDDPGIRTSLVRALRDRGHAVRTAVSAMEGLQAVLDESPDVVLLDLGLPDLDGATLLPMMRAVKQVPTIVITARDDETEIVRLLDAGADDYVTKPFGADHLDARIRAVLRRAEVEQAHAPVVVGGLVLDPRGRTVTLDGERLDLSRKEFDVLHHLAAHAGQVVSRRELLAQVWRQPYGGADKTVDVHLSWLRRKLGESAEAPRYLHSVRGVGIKLLPPESG
ncbi:MAG TPA: response regulator transcription factor [Actinopolymorphaceae bacterium]|nr:response regulator transcription factor [Actinopolymorphaceae bacterium]